MCVCVCVCVCVCACAYMHVYAAEVDIGTNAICTMLRLCPIVWVSQLGTNPQQQLELSLEVTRAEWGSSLRLSLSLSSSKAAGVCMYECACIHVHVYNMYVCMYVLLYTHEDNPVYQAGPFSLIDEMLRRGR